MSRRKVSPFIPIGLLMMSSALIWRNFMHGRFTDFAVGLLMGMSIAMMIGGLIKQRRSRSGPGKGDGSSPQ